MSRALVIGVGNRTRGDDAVGSAVIRGLRADPPAEVDLYEESGEATALIETWQGRERVILVDAAAGEGSPGTIRRFEAHEGSLPAALFATSTHGFGVAHAVELSRALRTLPPTLIVYAVEGEDFEAGHGLSLPVADAVREVVGQVRRDIQPNFREA
jgi:hydrogenase maturation protease